MPGAAKGLFIVASRNCKLPESREKEKVKKLGETGQEGLTLLHRSFACTDFSVEYSPMMFNSSSLPTRGDDGIYDLLFLQKHQEIL